MNNKSNRPICCDQFKQGVEYEDIVDYRKFIWTFESVYEELDGWYFIDEIGDLISEKLKYCPYCGTFINPFVITNEDDGI